MTLHEMISITKEDLKNHTDIPIKIFPDLETLYKNIARQMAELVKKNNESGQKTKMILLINPLRHSLQRRHVLTTS